MLSLLTYSFRSGRIGWIATLLNKLHSLIRFTLTLPFHRIELGKLPFANHTTLIP